MSNNWICVQASCICWHCCAHCNPGIIAKQPTCFQQLLRRVVLRAQSCVALTPSGVVSLGCVSVLTEVLCAVLASACCSELLRWVFVAVTAVSTVIVHTVLACCQRLSAAGCVAAVTKKPVMLGQFPIKPTNVYCLLLVRIYVELCGG